MRDNGFLIGSILLPSFCVVNVGFFITLTILLVLLHLDSIILILHVFVTGMEPSMMVTRNASSSRENYQAGRQASY